MSICENSRQRSSNKSLATDGRLEQLCLSEVRSVLALVSASALRGAGGLVHKKPNKQTKNNP